MPEDKFSDLTVGLESPLTAIEEITPDDAGDLAYVTRAVNVATSGTLHVTTVDGSTATLFLAAGGAFPIRVRRVWASGTSATGIRGLR
ncbi:hypothetical protein [Pseudoruegeria sp. SHC-113]|uniref:spike base protein, RCAP_Rcc01079 family n=1 Tax=Pseudoruegeria sp. SHC-113 TaxID=2855439 RepID=UPI0021BADB1B|nr:hypothetical protein [Pseudoruegeria sp. SHC-113]MCT8160783.1 hypothetical protein [Pseudoruegeria sp. SHC-113]